MAFNVAVELLHDTQHTAAHPTSLSLSTHGLREKNVDMERETAGEWMGMPCTYGSGIRSEHPYQARDTHSYSLRPCITVTVSYSLRPYLTIAVNVHTACLT
jgi:hypothetical protein